MELYQLGEPMNFVKMGVAAKASGLTRGQIAFRIDKGLIRAQVDPVSGHRKPLLEDVLRFTPQVVNETAEGGALDNPEDGKE